MMVTVWLLCAPTPAHAVSSQHYHGSHGVTYTYTTTPDIKSYHMVHTAKVQFDDLLFILLGAFLNFSNVQYAFPKNLRNHCIKMIRNILQLSTLQCDLNTIKHYITITW